MLLAAAAARRGTAFALVLAGSAGCTPIGAWVYTDPTVAVRGAHLTPTAVELELTFHNPNDYPVTIVQSTFALGPDSAPVMAGSNAAVIVNTRADQEVQIVAALDGATPPAAVNDLRAAPARLRKRVAVRFVVEVPFGRRTVAVRSVEQGRGPPPP